MTIEILSALWFGILTAISPCPLATNIAAVTFLSKKINHPRDVLFASIAYTAGRMFAYAVLGGFIISSIVTIPSIANFLQQSMNKILGPTLIIVGFFLLDYIKINIPRFLISQDKQTALVESGIKGAFMLGVLFSLSFCPIAAALFFGSLIPLALNSKIGIVLPFIYGIGTGIPVAMFSLGVVLGVKSLSKWFKNTSRIEFVTKRLTGIIFILVGFYFIWEYLIIGLF